MSVRRVVVYAGLTFSLASLAFSLGSWSAQRSMARRLADNDARLAALGDAVARGGLWPAAGPAIAGTTGEFGAGAGGGVGPASRALVDEVKRELQREMGLVPVSLLRERRGSFVELNAVDSLGKTSYGTAGYLGDGYFITVKHGVVALPDEGEVGRRITGVTIRHAGRDLPARVVDAGDAPSEVHPGDWAIIRVREPLDIPPLRIDVSYSYAFAEPIFRLGNDYSRGIILSTGYVGQRTGSGLVTCLTDGHPGVSGGGVLNQEGDLVGIPVGRMQGDYRFSFILPVRAEMFRRVPALREHVVPAAGPRAAGSER